MTDEFTPTTADELEAIVYNAAKANVGANMLNPYDILAAWLAAHDAETVRVTAEKAAAAVAWSEHAVASIRATFGLAPDEKGGA